MLEVGAPPGNENAIDRILRELRERMTRETVDRLVIIVLAFVVARQVVR